MFDLPNSLTVNNADLSRDFGLWRPADYGDNPNAPVQYPTAPGAWPIRPTLLATLSSKACTSATWWMPKMMANR